MSKEDIDLSVSLLKSLKEISEKSKALGDKYLEKHFWFLNAQVSDLSDAHNNFISGNGGLDKFVDIRRVR